MWCYDGDDVFANRALQKINTALGSFSTNQVKKLNQNYILHKQIKASGNSQLSENGPLCQCIAHRQNNIIFKTIKLSRACCQFFPHIYIYIHSLKFHVYGPQWQSVPEKMQKGEGEGLVTCIIRERICILGPGPWCKTGKLKKAGYMQPKLREWGKNWPCRAQKTSCYSFPLLIIGFHVPALP